MSEPTTEPPVVAAPPTKDQGGTHAVLVGTGILLSRISGLVRQRVFAHYFGLAAEADAFSAAFRIPNLLQNLFGEGVLSGSFIPVYARLVARGEDEEAGRVAGAVAAVLALVVSAIVLVGVLAAPLLTDLLAAGFEGPKRDLTVRIVRILFPGAGLLVLSAWCLGVLNSHRRFLLSYTAPVLWNAAMIVALVWRGGQGVRLDRLAIALAWASVVGSALQLLVQLPSVLALVRHLRLSLDWSRPTVRAVTRAFGGVFIGRGVVQISAYVDALIASFLPTGAVTALTNAQTLSLLPVSLFGVAVSAAELPAMAAAHENDRAGVLRRRLEAGLPRLAFFVVPSAVALLLLGDLLALIVFRTGRFTDADARYVWGILAGSAVGLLAATMGRLYASAFYARGDTRTPLRFALVRVALTVLLGWFAAMVLPGMLGVHPRWGAAGLTASAGVAAWMEYALLRRSSARDIGDARLPAGRLARLYAAATIAAGVTWLVRSRVGTSPPLAVAVALVALYCALYGAATLAMRVPEARAVINRVARRRV